MGRGSGGYNDGVERGRGMNCISCGREALLIRDLESHSGFHYQAWECSECDVGWVYHDGVLVGVSKAWETWKAKKVPEGCLVVIGKEEKVWLTK